MRSIPKFQFRPYMSVSTYILHLRLRGLPLADEDLAPWITSGANLMIEYAAGQYDSKIIKDSLISTTDTAIDRS